MANEILVGLDILDNQEYTKYREAMIPILSKYGGEFTYDFKVSQVLRSQTKEKINRVFSICFPDILKMEGFFSNDEYLLIKGKYFNSSVGSTTIIASYEKNI